MIQALSMKMDVKAKMVNMNVLLYPGKRFALVSRRFTGKKGRSKCRSAARQFYQITGKTTEVYQIVKPNMRNSYFFTVAGSGIQQRSQLITRYGALMSRNAGAQRYA